MERYVLVGNEQVVGVQQVPAVDDAGSIVPKAEFRRWLERHPDIGNLDGLLRKVVGKRASQCELDRLVDAVVTACRGAYAFELVDWRAPLRGEDAQLKASVAEHREHILELKMTLTAAPVRLKLLTEWFVAEVRARHGKDFELPFPAEGTLLELLELVAEGLETAEGRLQNDTLPHVQQHGCFDYGRPVPAKKFRDLRQMLGFNLVFLFRAATIGPWATTGKMPKGGRPNFEIAARLVAATLGEAADDAPATYEWMQSTERSIKRDNPKLAVVAWPVSTDEVGVGGWFAPSPFDG